MISQALMVRLLVAKHVLDLDFSIHNRIQIRPNIPEYHPNMGQKLVEGLAIC